MGVVRRFAVAGLDEAARRAGRRRGLRVGAIDETSQVKQGRATAGVKRQYLGCVGKVANGITTLHLAFRTKGEPSISAPRRSRTASPWTSPAATRFTATAPNCGSSSKRAAR